MTSRRLLTDDEHRGPRRLRRLALVRGRPAHPLGAARAVRARDLDRAAVRRGPAQRLATIWATRRLFLLLADQFVPAAALASAAAMLCDGVALTWTTLYGPDTKDLVPVAALLLWGVAAILVAAFAAAHRKGEA